MKTIYILHETYDLCDYNDHEVVIDKETAEKLFGQLREKLLNESMDERYPYVTEVYRDEENDLYIRNESDECIRIYITEHTID